MGRGCREGARGCSVSGQRCGDAPLLQQRRGGGREEKSSWDDNEVGLALFGRRSERRSGAKCASQQQSPVSPTQRRLQPQQRRQGRGATAWWGVRAARGAAAAVLCCAVGAGAALTGLRPARPRRRSGRHRARLRRALTAAISFVSFPCSLLRVPLCRCTSAPVFPCLNVSPPLPSAPVSPQTTARRPKVSTAPAVASRHVAGCCVASRRCAAPGGAHRGSPGLTGSTRSSGAV